MLSCLLATQALSRKSLPGSEQPAELMPQSFSAASAPAEPSLTPLSSEPSLTPLSSEPSLTAPPSSEPSLTPFYNSSHDLVFATESRHGCFKTAGCEPGEHNFWLFGTHHKTGTEFVNALFTVATGRGSSDPTECHAGSGSQPDCDGCTHNYTNFRLDKQCLHSAAAREGMIQMRMFHTNDTTWAGHTAAFKESGTKRTLRTVHMVRDPFEIILSAYFFNARGGEPAPKTGKFVRWMQQECATGEEDDAEVCRVVGGFNSKKTSWMEMLQQLPPKTGIVLQAAHELRSLKKMQQSDAALKQTPHDALRVDLNALMSDFNGTLGHMFRFLGVHAAKAPQCVAACAQLDRAADRSAELVGGCEERLKGLSVNTTGGDLTAAQRAELHSLAEKVGAFATRGLVSKRRWYAEYVEPLQKAIPAACEDLLPDKHSLPPYLIPLKESVGKRLRRSSYFKTKVAPIRQQMGY